MSRNSFLDTSSILPVLHQPGISALIRNLRKDCQLPRKNVSGFRLNSIVGKVLIFLVTRDWTGYLCLTWWTSALAHKLLNHSKTVVLHICRQCLYLMSNPWFLKTWSRLVHGGMVDIFSFLGFLFICADIFLYVDDFKIIENESSFRSLSSVTYKTVKIPSLEIEK